ncbi:non-homologous end-joining DNA ligase [Nitrospira moscoviensis]|uniref:non-homologous end-joining DNA ligase n=1 Tax=Nitrospira moscoviensis TaxID=42253 RepID=UPI0006A76272|nr:non-homologous end-joining DNA ligase [Nitrospira moscoviensis]
MKKNAPAQEDLVLHGVSITHPDRIVFERGRITKGEVARYYAAVAPFLLRDIRSRPITVVRCPSGVKADCFYQRNVGFGLGPHVHPFSWEYKGRSYKYIYVEDAQGIMEMIQVGVIEIHPWGATIDTIHMPDRMIFDLDPDEHVPFAKVKEAALEIRTRLKQAGLDSFLKTTGGKGLHVVAPLAPASPWDEVKDWARALAHQMVQDAPDTYVATITKAKRRGKILIDFFRNDYTATGIADYSLRARPGAPVAVPLEWHELTALHSANQFDMEAVLKRIQGHAVQQAEPKQRLPRSTPERMHVHATHADDSPDGSAPRRSAA